MSVEDRLSAIENRLGNIEQRLAMRKRPQASWLKAWLFTTDHKRVGILYFVTAFYFLFIGGILAVLMRTQLAYPENTLLTAAAYNQAVSMHGLIMVLWFLSPLGAAFANYFVPLQIGAKDVAFPRFNAFSYWMYAFGGLVALSGFFVPGGAASAGWTNYAPLNSKLFLPGGGETLIALGLLMLWGSLTMGGVNLVTTILTMRAPGMTWTKMPMFTWFTLATQLMLLWSVPSIFAGTLALIVDRSLGSLFFVTAGGSSVLWDHMWWFFGHPEVYVVILPGLGAVAEIFSVFSGRPVFAKKAILASLFLGFFGFSFAIYGHHMFLTGINALQREIFTVNTEINTLPSGLIVICFAATMVGGAVRFKTPLLMALGSIATFVIGGISGVFDSSLFLDVQFRGGYQVVSHFHYIMVGTAEFALFGAIYYWLPRWTGRMYNETVGKIHFILSFVFFNLLFFPMNLLLDMPRRIYTYGPATGWGGLNFIETIGAWGFALSQILLLYVMIEMAMFGRPAGSNPWHSSSPEWTGDVKSYVANYPAVYAAGSNAFDGGSPSRVHGPATPLNTAPLVISAGLALAFLGLVVSLPLLLVGIVIGVWGVGTWFKDDLYGLFKVPEEPPGDKWPFTHMSHTRVGIWLTIAGEMLLFTAVIGSYLFIRENVPIWPAATAIHNIRLATFNTMLLLSSGMTVFLALYSIRNGNRNGLVGWLSASFVLATSFLSIKIFEWWKLYSDSPPFTIASGLPGSTYYFMTGIHAVHVLVGLALMAFLITKGIKGGFTKSSHDAVENFALYWAFVDAVWIFLFPLLYLL
jgi:cytochrome c oxidase subunit I+III